MNFSKAGSYNLLQKFVMKIYLLQKLLGPLGIILLSLVIILLWFGQGLLFAGAEDELFFYNFTKSLQLFSHIWYQAGTGYPTLFYLPRISYFLIFEPLYILGIPNIVLEAATFLLLILTGILSVFFLLRETISNDLKDEWKRLIPFLGAIFYLLNPFSTTQIWGRGLTYQIFSFALIPVFLLFFVLSIQRRNLVFCLFGALSSFFLSTAYTSPAVVITSWANLGIYLAFFVYLSRKDYRGIFFAAFSILLLFLFWILLNFFWIYPTIKYGTEILNQGISGQENLLSLKGLAPGSHLLNALRLIHREYYDGTYGIFFTSLFITILSWLLPLFFLFSIPLFKRIKHFTFYLALFLISIFITIGANFPTGWLLILLFEKLPLLQVLRNPYEKFGINLVLAYSPFFAIGLISFCEKLAIFYKIQRLKYFLIPLCIILMCVVLVWPMWKGNFAGGIHANFWVEVPRYYKEANEWLNSQKGDFTILHLPLRPEDGITYTWEHPYEGIEPSEFLFDKRSTARNFGVNRKYYSLLLTKFGASIDYKKLPYWSNDFEDLNEDELDKVLTKLNARFIILHFDTDYQKRRAISPEETKKYLESQSNITRVKKFEKLEIYRVDMPDNIDLIYSPNLKVEYEKINTSNYLVDIRDAKEEIDIYFLQQFHPGWKAFINGEEIEKQSEVLSYANKWRINKSGNYQVIIKFVQQDFVNIGAKITYSTISILMIIVLFYLIKTRKFFF